MRNEGRPTGPKQDDSSLRPGQSQTSNSPISSPGPPIPELPHLSLPTGGGAIHSLDEKLAVNPTDGAATVTVSLGISSARSGFSPALALTYSSNVGNGPFGIGWQVDVPAISRKTSNSLPQYYDALDSDTFLLAGIEDLVPRLRQTTPGTWERDQETRNGYLIQRYCLRIEGSFTRIERWSSQSDGTSHWRTISPTNITTIYGDSDSSRIADPDDPLHVFTWLISQSFDDMGNAIFYTYKDENADGIVASLPQERSRLSKGHFAQRYLKHIYYCKHTPYSGDTPLSPTDDWLMQVVFDYGEHTTDTPDEQRPWLCRNDPFSTYRGGFDLRTYRLCQRVLMFHSFPELGDTPCLINSTAITYRSLRGIASDQQLGDPRATFIASITHFGYQRQSDGSYTHLATPPTDFEYSLATISHTVQTLDAESQHNLPQGLTALTYQWVDLYGEGIAGIFTEQAGGWYYKSNLGRGQFGPLQKVTPRPSWNGVAQGRLQLADITGEGTRSLLKMQTPLSGFYSQSSAGTWEGFRPFQSQPTIDWNDPTLRFLDVTGDGTADLLLTGEDAIIWYPALGTQGYGAAQQVRMPLDEERGPRLIFTNDVEAIFLADMTGDGLIDLVRVRNGDVCYWPNLGYGRFGGRIPMNTAPFFDHPELFQQQRVRLADIDGTGTTDILYLGRDTIQVYFNEAGNGWSTSSFLPPLPSLDDQVFADVVDLFGNGTACLVWSSPFPHDIQHPLRYIDLMGGHKPHLMVQYVNNLGKEGHLEYQPSTAYYLADKKAGTPWITKLPFPTQCLSRTTVTDAIRQTVFVSSYTYHHGYYDSIEREFRGFGRVEQLDTEQYQNFTLNSASNVVEQDLHQPPVLTKTWFHTGAFFDRTRILNQFQSEYYQDTVHPEHHLTPPALPELLTADECRQALRAFKGRSLRQEVYAMDSTPAQPYPYSTNEANYQLQLVQPSGNNPYAVFQVMGSETLGFGYERNPGDPRIAHTIILAKDELGLVRQAASLVYPRVITEPSLPASVQAAQSQGYITYTETDYTNDVIAADTYRLRVPAETRAFELTGLSFNALLTAPQLADAITQATAIPFETLATGGLQKRLIGQQRLYYLKDDLSGALPLGQQGSLGLPFQHVQLAMTTGFVAQFYAGKVSDAQLTAAGYIHSEGDAHWWVPSGRVLYPANAASHFYLPVRYRDPLGSESAVVYDPYDLLVLSLSDALNNQITAQQDYRLLAPILVTDANSNRTAIAADELGHVIKLAVMGKALASDGDTLSDPTVKMEYSLFNWMNLQQPNYVHTFAREQHGAANPRWQESFSYSDGSGQIIMTKVQAKPGKAQRWNKTTHTVEVVDTTPAVRWIGNGRTVYNNKGNPVKRYEPYFSATADFENADQLVATGVTAVLYYDPIDRNIRTELPNGTFSKIVFDSWQQHVFDTNDTVLDSRWYRDRSNPDPLLAEPTDPEQRAAWLAAKHANTPSILHTDSLGRPIYAISDNGSAGNYAVRSEIDLTGRFSRAYDQKNRLVASGVANMVGQPVTTESAETGVRWLLSDIMGKLVTQWDDTPGVLSLTYDPLHRPQTTVYTNANHPHGLTFLAIFYGELLSNARDLNLLGKPYQIYDQSGVMTTQRCDFKGNVTQVARQFTQYYQGSVDWSPLTGLTDSGTIAATAKSQLDTEVFSGLASFDALNRPTRVQLADQTIIQPTYNQSNNLETLSAQIRGQGPFTSYLTGQDYDAKGQRQFATFGNSTITQYFYEAQTFRLSNLLTQRAADPSTQSLQNLTYIYDPVGNITQINDAAQQTYYFRNAVVKPENRYEYDAIYRLIKATGREHAGLVTPPDNSDVVAANLPETNDTTAVQRYTEWYSYDELGNILQMQHTASSGNWTRRYHYAYQDNAADRTNRLLASSLPGDPAAGPYTGTYSYDGHGNMTHMPNLATLTWNFQDQLQQVDLGGGGTAYYTYGGSNRRMRKVIQRNGALREECLYLGAVEIYRKWRDNTLILERQTVHISDDSGRIAQVDTKTVDRDNAESNPLNVPVVRYQYGNHLGSVSLETDDAAQPISYEEYHPYGTTSYRSSKPGVNLSLKRYRFTHKEHDDESGLYYHGARYYAPWLGRWTSTDPAGFVDGLNLYTYVSNKPVVFHDLNGLQQSDTEQRFSIPGAISRRGAQAVEQYLHEQGFEFSGPVRPGRRGGWDVGRWIRIPGQPDAPTPPADRPSSQTDAAETPPATGTESGNEPSGKGTQPDSNTQSSPDATPPGTNPQGNDTGQKSDSTLIRGGAEASNYLGAEGAVANTIRQLDNANKALIGRNAATILENLPETTQTLDNLQRIARAAFLARNASRAASQRLLLPLARAWSSYKEIPRTFSQLLNQRIAEAGGDLAEGFKGVAVGAGKGRASATAAAGRVGIFGRVLGGVGIGLSAYALYTDIKTENYGVTLGDAAGIISGGLAVAGSGPASLAVGGVALANMAGDLVDTYVERKTGSRTAGVLAGTVAGAATGAAVGALVGSIVPVIGTAVGAGVGAAIGAIAGFVGAYW